MVCPEMGLFCKMGHYNMVVCCLFDDEYYYGGDIQMIYEK